MCMQQLANPIGETMCNLTDDEIADICYPLTQPAAQIRFLRDELSLHVKRKPNGKPLVTRANYEKVMMGGDNKEVKTQEDPPVQPDEAALILYLNRNKIKNDNGQNKKRQPPKAA